MLEKLIESVESLRKDTDAVSTKTTVWKNGYNSAIHDVMEEIDKIKNNRELKIPETADGLTVNMNSETLVFFPETGTPAYPSFDPDYGWAAWPANTKWQRLTGEGPKTIESCFFHTDKLFPSLDGSKLGKNISSDESSLGGDDNLVAIQCTDLEDVIFRHCDLRTVNIQGDSPADWMFIPLDSRFIHVANYLVRMKAWVSYGGGPDNSLFRKA